MRQQGLRVLVVDDAQSQRVVLEVMLRQMGHTPLLAESGREAIELFREHVPDVVLVDVVMPEMDGFETVRILRSIARHWVPLVFVSGKVENQSIVQGLQCGADDYLVKPINYYILEVKLKALSQRIQMTNQLAVQNRRLADYKEKSEDESRLAQEFMRRLAAFDKICDPLVNFHLLPAEDFSGDLIAVARTPAGQLHVMLADSTGHGLTSALAVMPVLQPFQVMSLKGFSISAIAEEINRKVREYLPQNRFVATILLSLDTENRMIEVWNGGCPPAILLNPEGEVWCKFASTHLPLGILPAEQFDDVVERYCYGERPCQMVMSSDGAVDCADHTSLERGMESLLDSARGVAPDGRLGAMLTMLDSRLATLESRDDIALIFVDCPVNVRADLLPAQAAHPVMDGDGSAGCVTSEIEWQFALTLTAPQLKRLDVVPLLLNLVNQIEPENAGVAGKLFLVMSELFNNALDHGLLKLDSTLKHDSTGMERYYEQRISRLKQLEHGEIFIGLEKVCSGSGMNVRVTFRDSGDGFDHASLCEATQDVDERRHGRGIALVQSLSHSVEFLAGGAEVRVTLPLA